MNFLAGGCCNAFWELFALLGIFRFPVSNFQIFIGIVFFFSSAVIFELKTDQQIGLCLCAQRLHSDQTVQFLSRAHVYRVRVESVECVAGNFFSGSTFFPHVFYW